MPSSMEIELVVADRSAVPLEFFVKAKSPELIQSSRSLPWSRARGRIEVEPRSRPPAILNTKALHSSCLEGPSSFPANVARPPASDRWTMDQWVPRITRYSRGN
jgi:hypothetical protein